ncbi:MAG TPA: S8 family serine peptidase [Cyclobacteriaceae bacterium]|nr:S8 family serine peptidase [Cyclobacteriaceae bacterium]
MKSPCMSIRYGLEALLFLACGLFIADGFSQGRQRTLQQIDQDYQDYRKGADARIQDYIKQNPSALVTFKKNHVVYLMTDVSESGMPIYIKTNNADEAVTLNVPQLRTGGSLGINILGTGMKIGTWDGGRVRNDHVELVGRVTFGDAASTFEDHATHTSGTMIASGVNPSAKGMAPAATLLAYDFINDVSEMTTQAKPDQTSLILSNHSYGTVCGWQYDGTAWTWHGDAAISATEDYKFGYYDTQAQQWDGIAFSAPYYLIVKAAGNDRSDTGDGSKPRDGGTFGFDCIPTYGTAKNSLTVGAVQNLTSYQLPSDVLMTNFSSWGPTDDGRIKPDIVAPGLQVFSTTAGSTTEYQKFDGTSMATPAVTGTLALLQQLYKSLNSGNYMKSATLKALAIHSAREAGLNPGPDYSYGWGLLDAEGAAKIIINKDNQNIFMREAALVSGQTSEMDLGIPKVNTKIKITLV